MAPKPKPRPPLPELLAAFSNGTTHQQIANRYGVSKTTVGRWRLDVTGEHAPPGRPPGRTKPRPALHEQIAAHLRPDGEHLLWAGPTRPSGSPVYYRREPGQPSSVKLSARTAVWTLHRGRPPVGQVRPICGVQLCLAPSHLLDSRDRDEERKVAELLRRILAGARAADETTLADEGGTS